jgi:hypothetical protein
MWAEGVKMNMNVLNNSVSLGFFSSIRGDLFSSVEVEEIQINMIADRLSAFSGSSSSDQGNLYSSVGAKGRQDGHEDMFNSNLPLAVDTTKVIHHVR